ncbi:MAG: hypothetical protein KDD56_00320 [Bdellovibrionales bacterium]|nr:hypothetical protein [Bdellovibrionales bacterium]
MIIWTLLGAVISVALIIASLKYLKKSVASSIQAEKNVIVNKVTEVVAHLDTLASVHEGFASKAQLDSLTGRVSEIKANLEKEKAVLSQVEEKLGGAQKIVEEKEAVQQDIKSAKEEDEIKLEQLLGAYDSVSNETIELEQKLAATLKNLDSMAEETGIDPNLKLMLEELSSVLTNAGSRLRDLLTEYQSVNERIQTLKSQHEDLEEEYTRLVEQQLGE